MTSTALKILALVLMFLDHIAEFIPGTPIWLHWLGRVSAELFLFCMCWGFHYTHDRKLYLKRMYLFGVLMACGNLAFNLLWPDPVVPIFNNIFVILLITGILCGIIDLYKTDKKKMWKYLIYFFLFQVASTVIITLAISFIKEPVLATEITMFIGAILPNMIFSEGSIIIAAIGLLIYYTKESKTKLAIAYTLFCIIYMVFVDASGGWTADNLLFTNYQWMMIAAIIPMLLYNGKKGKGYKYLFYIFYPVHIYLLFIIGNLIK